MRATVRRLLHFLRRSRHDADLREEMEGHRALRQAALERDGLAPDDAAWASRRAMGNVTLAVEDAREVWVVRWIDHAWQDIRFALRGLRRSPSFAFAAICTFALGIGANTAIFGIISAALLKPLPYANPDGLVTVSVFIPRLQARFPSLPVRAADFEEFRRSNAAFLDMAAIRDRNVNLTGGGEPERLSGARVSANLFALLGVRPRLGRTFMPEEDLPGRDKVVVISHDLWTRRFGSDPGIIHRTVLLDGEAYRVVGIMPAGFLFPTGKQLNPHVELGPRIDVWKPAAFTRDDLKDELVGFNWGVIGRLKPGASPEIARANLDAIARSIAERARTKAAGLDGFELRTRVGSLRDVYFGSVRQGLLILMGAVGLLLVIACVNLVNLLLARLTSRSRELATRAALGAHPGRLVRQLLTESVIVAMVGGIVGLPVAAWGAEVLVWFGPSDLPAQATWLDGPVLLFAMVVALVSGVAVGLPPAVAMVRGPRSRNDQLADGGRSMTEARGSGYTRRTLVVSEVALCTALLVIAGLLVRSFLNVMRVDTGFEAERVLAIDLSLSPERYEGKDRVAFYRDLLDSVRALPGVASAGAISILPLTSESEGNTLLIYRDSDTEARLDRPEAYYRAVTPGYFAAMGIPLSAGRLPEAQDAASDVIVSEGLARRLWPGVPPSRVIGRRVKVNEVTDDPATIAGVVGDVRTAALDREPTPALYVPHARTAARAMTIVIRTVQDPATIAAAVRAQIRQRDDAIPVETVRTMREIVLESAAQRRFHTMLVLVCALLALGLALVGVYGVTSFAVARRTREIGVRVALGAQRSDLLKSVLTQGLWPVAAGVLCGLAIGWVTTTTVRSFLFGVAPLDPVVLSTVCITLMATAAIACYVPARRATRIDPVVALHHD
jgi:predicted permease